MRLIVRHQLAFIAHADHLLTGLDQSSHHARNLHAAITESERVADGNAVCVGIFFRKPYAIGAVFVVGIAAHKIHARHLLIFGNAKRHTVALLLLDIHIHTEISGSRRHAVQGCHAFRLFGRKSGFGHQAIVGIPGFVKKILCILANTHPLHVEPDKNADTKCRHNCHGDELRPVKSHSTPQLFK